MNEVATTIIGLVGGGLVGWYFARLAFPNVMTRSRREKIRQARKLAATNRLARWWRINPMRMVRWGFPPMWFSSYMFVVAFLVDNLLIGMPPEFSRVTYIPVAIVSAFLLGRAGRFAIYAAYPRWRYWVLVKGVRALLVKLGEPPEVVELRLRRLSHGDPFAEITINGRLVGERLRSVHVPPAHGHDTSPRARL